ncbi:hypothetical protein K3727_03730 [Rhodobacteraceae bacterium M382]|nr:hypothetical protein K3727_03730 [Rhodobacteraceae bacterium M382]
MTNTPKQKDGLDAVLRRNRVLTRSWSQTSLDDAGCVHLANESGTAVPIFWCFNTEREFPKLAAALGPDQPLAGMRSLNGVIDPSKVNSSVAHDLAEHFAIHLFRHFGTSPCVVGGNCQSAILAYRTALCLQALGGQVLRLVTLDAEVRYPYPGHVHLLFGRDSTKINPFYSTQPDRTQGPLRNWSIAYGSCEWSPIDGQHAQYFQPENIVSLARAIVDPGPVVPSDIARQHNSAPQPPETWHVLSDTPENVTLRAPRSHSNGSLALVPVWGKRDGSLFRISDSDWVLDPINAPDLHFCIPRPSEPGPWLLWPVLCQHGYGPIDWPFSQFQPLEFD